MPRKVNATTCVLDLCLSWLIKDGCWRLMSTTYCIIYLKDRGKTSFAINILLRNRKGIICLGTVNWSLTNSQSSWGDDVTMRKNRAIPPSLGFRPFDMSCVFSPVSYTVQDCLIWQMSRKKRIKQFGFRRAIRLGKLRKLWWGATKTCGEHSMGIAGQGRHRIAGKVNFKYELGWLSPIRLDPFSPMRWFGGNKKT